MALADDLIDIPTARKIIYEDLRYEFRSEPLAGGDYQHFLGIGLGPAFELDLRDQEFAGSHPVGTFDFSYNLVAALPAISPGISFGVQDAANETRDGRRFFAVTTFRNGEDFLPGNLYSDITLGFQVGSLTSPFIGVLVPAAPQVYFLAEDSGFRINAGVELRPMPKVALRFIYRGNEPMLSLSAMGRF